MDAAIRHLRDGTLPDSPVCSTCCIFDNLEVTAGTLVFSHAVQIFLSAMRQGRSQATWSRLVDPTGALADVVTAAPAKRRNPCDAQPRPPPPPDIELIDLYSDPWGWRQFYSSASSEHPPGSSPEGEGSGSRSGPAKLVTSLAALQTALMRPPPQSADASASAGESAAMAPLDTGDSNNQACSDTGDSSGGGGGHDIAAATRGPSSRSVCVIISCLSTLMERYGELQALGMLEAVQQSPVVSCVLTLLHTDLHPSQLVFALRRWSSCCVDLSSLTELQAEVAQRSLESGTSALAGAALAGRLDCRMKRRTGRVKVESELYSLRPAIHAGNESPTSQTAGSGTATTAIQLVFHPVPPLLNDPDPKTLLQLKPPAAALTAPKPAATAAPAGRTAVGAATPTAAPTAGAGPPPPVGLLAGLANPEELARAMGSNMRLTLTEEERCAKQQVVLPYQHQGQQHRSGTLAAAYAAGDHVGYLPPAAGGTGPGAGGGGQQALGHILYVRDSASEADSDQELDEDLDI